MTSDKAPPAGQTTRKLPRNAQALARHGRGPRFGKAGKPANGKGGPRRPTPPGAIDVAVLYGWHPVVEALANPRRRPRRLMATENAYKRLLERFGHLPIAPEIVRPGEIDRLLEPDAVHQGLLLEADPLPSPAIDSLPADALVLVLDQITDPHNVGAIVRTAAAFSVAAIVTTARHSPAATGVLAKSASGGLEHVPFIVVRNLAEAMLALRERGFQLVGLDSAGPTPLGDIPLTRPLGLVLGAEGKGLRQLTRERCSDLARLDMPGAIKSLNVSNAAAIALYAASRTAG
ncbi:RNA methyltransferase [Chelatococcus daeguensis]|uniref:tRNA G18 (Ribose-2'-O)-methylase SpoU n=1 Tax=Chelatococcus sambhunathii TaxID=363953 RepID=A0ABM9TWH6_9HYPH|nr:MULTISPECIES: RNA methyltransferase [Chelatococcus]MBM3083327.1 RNA methyltransferase [Chelatococcus daeguensis]CUA83705.1 tRNA G18 (ribose-2'-O)-methylase SpoU [Chelatococcus sambhunathii]